MQKLNVYVFLLTGLVSIPAHAYIEPGAEAGTLAIVFGVIASSFLALIAIAWHPKRLINDRKKQAIPTQQSRSHSE